MKQYIQKMLDSGIRFEIHGDYSTVGLAWGESKKARESGFARKDVMEALDWAETNKEEAKKLFNV